MEIDLLASPVTRGGDSAACVAPLHGTAAGPSSAAVRDAAACSQRSPDPPAGRATAGSPLNASVQQSCTVRSNVLRLAEGQCLGAKGVTSSSLKSGF